MNNEMLRNRMVKELYIRCAQYLKMNELVFALPVYQINVRLILSISNQRTNDARSKQWMSI
jgi:hypothetical protein